MIQDILLNVLGGSLGGTALGLGGIFLGIAGGLGGPAAIEFLLNTFGGLDPDLLTTLLP
ncbi:hypothetical protein [Hoyosella subflava]|uniref:Uncharacterized protein n=1 Tax=Hoyosella subflava (strain DSM 45089 / JCM 17490 / NBRC 109087 / DQS3-9A1) TaxID=443218 RepID=F6EGG5_HOYSD|nr:hypothetical protein [Hoyosella subflava]AEF41018.1 hypothetical protein AS9A_2571 [Hoyosella subflava DQS3-9A1]